MKKIGIFSKTGIKKTPKKGEFTQNFIIDYFRAQTISK